MSRETLLFVLFQSSDRTDSGTWLQVICVAKFLNTVILISLHVFYVVVWCLLLYASTFLKHEISKICLPVKTMCVILMYCVY